jgi:hypothetical protein
MAQCSLCRGPADEKDDRCSCEALICESCDREHGIPGVVHRPEDHLKVHRVTFLETLEEDPPEAQKENLEKAWRKGFIMAKTPRFRRMMPIKKRKD